MLGPCVTYSCYPPSGCCLLAPTAIPHAPFSLWWTRSSEDEFDVGYVYGPEATHSDIAARSLLPLLRKFVDGYNVTVMAFGPTGGE